MTAQIETELTAKNELITTEFYQSLSRTRKESGYYDLNQVKRVVRYFGFDLSESPADYNHALTSVKIFLFGFESLTVTAI